MAIGRNRTAQWKKITAVAAAVFLILSLFFLKLPGWVEKELSRRWSTQFLGEVRVKIDAGGSWNFFRGRIRTLTVEGKVIKINESGPKVAALRAQWSEFSFDPFTLFFSGKLKIVRPGTGDIYLRFTEQDLNEYLQTLRFSGLISPILKLEPQGATLRAKLKWGNFPSLVIKTEPFIAGPSSLGFRAVGLEMAGWHLPPALEKSVLSKARFTLGWEGLPFPLFLNKVEVGPGNLILRGSTSR